MGEVVSAGQLGSAEIKDLLESVKRGCNGKTPTPCISCYILVHGTTGDQITTAISLR